MQNNAKKERDLTSIKVRFFNFLSIKEKLTKDAKRNCRTHFHISIEQIQKGAQDNPGN
jgi:hypothetical protein